MKRGYFKNVDFDKFKEFAKDHTVKEIMEEYSLTNSKARFIVNHYKIIYKPHYNAYNRNYDIDTILKDRQKGYTLRKIAEKFNTTNTTVYNICKKYGVEPYKPYKKTLKKIRKPDVFEYANKICKKIKYKGTFDYINQNGYVEFQKQITPIIKKAIENETVTTSA